MRSDVYGLVTTGVYWRMVKYDGKMFVMSDIFELVFNTMARNKERWMKNCSGLIDCLLFVLTNEGPVVKDGIVRG